MGAWGRHRRAGTAAVVLILGLAPGTGTLVAAELGEPPPLQRPAVSPSDRIRAVAEAAEKAGDWEAAFSAYCRLYVADRGCTDIRERLNNALRRAQQIRRFTDPTFRQFTLALTPPEALTLYADL